MPKTRIDLDVYETRLDLAYLCCKTMAEYIYMPDYATIIEPSCGSGAFIKSARTIWPSSTIHGVDIRPVPMDLLKDGATKVTESSWEDFKVNEFYSETDIDLIVGNPPYYCAEEHIKLALERVREGGYVAFLLRLDFLGTRKRFLFWNENKARYLFPLAGRPSFTVDGRHDFFEYAFFVWQKGHTKPFEIMPHIWLPQKYVRRYNTSKLSKE